MQLRLGLALAISAMSLVGCGRFALNNHSLDYLKAKELAPLEYPADATVRPPKPLYPAPTVDELAIQNAPKFINQNGNRYALPRPETLKSNAAQMTSTSDVELGRPQLVQDGNRNPLLRVQGSSSEVWRYTLAALNSLNYKVTPTKTNYQTTIQVNDKSYVLKLNAIGSNHTIALFNADNSFADREVAAEVLTQIYQNWPA